MRANTKSCIQAVLALIVLGFTQAAWAADALGFFQNYFVTGDYAAAGVGLRGTGVGGWATGAITMSGLPCTVGIGPSANFGPCNATGAVPADVIAAFLYWQTEETTSSPSGGNGYFDFDSNGRPNPIVGLALGSATNPGCSSYSPPAQTYARVYRADVLRYLTIDQTNNVRLANGTHTVTLPDSGSARNAQPPFTNGATLVVVYRTVVPGQPLIARFRAVVLYDGAFTMTSRTPGFTLTVGGFFQAGDGSFFPNSPQAKMTPLVGNGQPGSQEALLVNGQNIALNPFTGRVGARWDDPTFNIFLQQDDSSYQTQVNSFDNGTCSNVRRGCHEHRGHRYRPGRPAGRLGGVRHAHQHRFHSGNVRKLP